MVKESGIGHAHNSTAGSSTSISTIKLFGVSISPETSHSPLRRSSSLDSLSNHYDSHHVEEAGYLSDGPCDRSKRGNSSHPRNRGKPWTEEEHRTFLAGLKIVGKGHWREISKNFVTTKTPTQVASHAQKYFLRQTNQDKKKRRLSVFDIPLQGPGPAPLDSSNEILSSSQVTCTSTTAQVMERFPALCLDPRPVVPVARHGNIAFLMPTSPATVHGSPVAGMYPSPAYCLVTAPGECSMRIPEAHGNMGKFFQPLHTHPSGIPSPCSYPRPASSRRGPLVSSPADKAGIGLELGLPRDPEKDRLSSPTQVN